MSMMSIRAATPRDRDAIRRVEEHAFGQQAEAGLVDALVGGGDTVLELVAVDDGQVVGHVLFSRLYVEKGAKKTFAVALDWPGWARSGKTEEEATQILEDAGLVTSEKIGRVRHCRLGPRRLEEEIAWMAQYQTMLEARYDRLGAFLERTRGENP